MIMREDIFAFDVFLFNAWHDDGCIQIRPRKFLFSSQRQMIQISPINPRQVSSKCGFVLRLYSPPPAPAFKKLRLPPFIWVGDSLVVFNYVRRDGRQQSTSALLFLGFTRRFDRLLTNLFLKRGNTETS